MSDIKTNNHRLDREALKEYIRGCSETTKFYVGCDSERVKKNGKWYADYIIVLLAHLDGCKGAKIFAEVQREPDYDHDFSKPFTRMMNETYKVSEFYLELVDALKDRDVQIHIDINPNENAGSNCAFKAACGYIKGVCQVEAVAKPDAFAASYAADRAKGLGLALLAEDLL